MSPATGKTADSDFVTWSVPLLPSMVEYPPEVMDEVRAYACDELRHLAHGGREVGGVLFGVRRDRTVRILTWRPIACEYADGDKLHLSPGDALRLAVQIERARTDRNLKDLRPVGWFICHPSGSVSLSRSDRETYNGFFPEAWQMTLLLRPLGGSVVRAGFFGRELDGTLKTDASYWEFSLEPLHAPPAAEGAVTVESAEITVPPMAEEELASDAGPSPALLPSFRTSEPAPSRERWMWAVPVALALLLIGLALYHWRSAPGASRSTPQTANPASAAPPGPDVKPAAASTASPNSQSPAPPPAAPDSSEAAQLRAQRDALQVQLRQKDDELRKQRARVDQLQNLVRILEDRLNIQSGGTTSAAK